MIPSPYTVIILNELSCFLKISLAIRVCAELIITDGPLPCSKASDRLSSRGTCYWWYRTSWMFARGFDISNEKRQQSPLARSIMMSTSCLLLNCFDTYATIGSELCSYCLPRTKAWKGNRPGDSHHLIHEMQSLCVGDLLYT